MSLSFWDSVGAPESEELPSVPGPTQKQWKILLTSGRLQPENQHASLVTS